MSEIDVKKDVRTTNGWIIYFIILGIIQSLWTNLSAFPPLPLRLIMIVATFAPAFIKYDLVIFVIPFSLILRGNLSSDYQYLPDIYSYYIYICLEIILIFWHYKKIKIINYKYFIPLIFIMIYMGFIDIIYNGEIGKYSIHIFISALLIPFIRTEKNIHLLSAALISVCAILSIHYFIMYDTFLETWNKTNEIERSGWNDPNYFSIMLDSGFMVSIMYIINSLNSKYFIFNKKTLIIISVIIFIAVVMTASRAGFLCFILLLIAVLTTSKIKFHWYIIGTLIIYSVFMYVYKSGVANTLIFRFFEEGNANTGGGRTEIWGAGLNNFNSQSWIKQVFGGGYWHRAQLTNGRESHNEFIAMILDYGYLGIILFLTMIISLCKIKKGKILLILLPVFYFIMSNISLSQFQYLNIGFILIWITSIKMYFVKK